MALKISHIDEFKCIGCSACVQACMNDVIHMQMGKAVVVYQEDCSQCFACEMDCPRGAIKIGPYREPA